jgi:ribosomal protein S18 acetylase RimI-like enzyme
MGRIIGDGIYFYIQDVIVSPNFKQKGIGSRVMQELENWLDKTSQPNTFIGLMAAKGTFEFYRNFDYRIRDIDKPGMFKIKKIG